MGTQTHNTKKPNKNKKQPLNSTQETNKADTPVESLLAESQKRNQVLTSLVTSLRAQLVSNDSNELHEQMQDLKTQLKEVRKNYDEAKTHSQSLSLELFEAVEFIEKNFHIVINSQYKLYIYLYSCVARTRRKFEMQN